MKRHLFFSGPSGIGKSTALQTVLNRLNLQRVGGFVTLFDAPRGAVEKRLYLHPFWLPRIWEDSRCVAKMSGKDGVPPMVFPAAFDEIGVHALTEQTCPCLLVMDECGRLERHALDFQQAVLSALEETVPILGVLHYKPCAFTEKIRTHPNVEVLELTAENRELVAEAAYIFMKSRCQP